ncbi:MAG: response regulator transcription factor [Nitrospira sp.]|nr:response regulator transcription factor [Nitrospira sp.]MDH4245699.1 response regulator transcription factor [Nitrospira sp.]MDH4356035.1 response regulator transcription factor [Nitrospira sp.]MDH5320448.1 response regulator transcription factor [Nitrospira sp.]
MPSFAILQTASRLDELEAVLGSDRSDLLVVEFGLLSEGGVYRQRICALSSEVKTLVIDVSDNEDEILYCIERVGASGYLPHNTSVEELIRNIKAIMRGETLCSPRIAHLSFQRMSQRARRGEEAWRANGTHLTRRETEILRLVEHGLSNKEIATRLKIEVSTVKNHMHNILDKLQLPSRHSAVNHLKEQGFSVPRS